MYLVEYIQCYLKAVMYNNVKKKCNKLSDYLIEHVLYCLNNENGFHIIKISG